MEEQFIGLDNSVNTEYVGTDQLKPIFYDSNTRTITYPSGENSMQLGTFIVPSEEMVYLLVIDTSTQSYDVIVEKGTSFTNTTQLFELNINNGDISIVNRPSYMHEIETYLNGTELVIIAHFSPSLYYPVTPENVYLTTGASGDILAESLMVNGYHEDYVQSIYWTDRFQKVFHPCDAQTYEIGGMFDWSTYPTGKIAWTSWGQENITFEYLDEVYPDATMEDFY